MRAALATLLVGSLIACAKGGSAPTKPKGPVGPAIDAKEAEEGASDLVTEIYETLGRGNKDSLFTLLDDSLIVFGPRSADMLGTRADALVALEQVVDLKAKKTLKIRSGKLGVVPAPGGRSAWVFDAANINGQPHTVMAVLTNAADLWLVDAVAIARAPAMQQVKAELAKDAVVPPGAAGPKKVDPEARLAVEKFQRGLLDQAMWGEELAARADAIAIGPTAGEVARGTKEIKAMWKKRVDAKTRAAIAGEITASVTDDGQLAWVSAPITRVEGDSTQPLPLRAFAVFEQSGGDWKMIALHESLALGDPGAGAGFKKIVPPKPAEPKPPEVIADKPKAKGETAKEKPAKAKVATETPKKKVVKEEEPKKVVKEEEPKKKVVKEEEPKKVAKEEEPKKKLAKAEEEPKKKAKVEEEAPKKKLKAKAEDEDQPKKKAKADDEDEPKKKKLAKADDEDEPKKKKAKAKAGDGEGDEEPKKKKKRTFANLSDDGGEEPKKKSKKSDDDEEEAPKKKAKADDEEEAPKKKAKAKPDAEDEAPKKKAKDEDQPKKKAKDEPKKKKPAAEEDEDEIEVID